MSKLIGRWVDGSTISNFHMDHTDSYELGSLILSGDSSVGGDSTVSGNLKIESDTTVSGNLKVDGTAQIGSGSLLIDSTQIRGSTNIALNTPGGLVMDASAVGIGTTSLGDAKFEIRHAGGAQLQLSGAPYAEARFTVDLDDYNLKIEPLQGGAVYVPDGKYLGVGDGAFGLPDLYFTHNGSNTQIKNNTGLLDIFGSEELRLQAFADDDVSVFAAASSDETKQFKIYGYRSGDALRSLNIVVGRDESDTASFDGVTNYRFDGTVTVGSNSVTIYDKNIRLSVNDSTYASIYVDSFGNTYINNAGSKITLDNALILEKVGSAPYIINGRNGIDLKYRDILGTSTSVFKISSANHAYVSDSETTTGNDAVFEVYGFTKEPQFRIAKANNDRVDFIIQSTNRLIIRPRDGGYVAIDSDATVTSDMTVGGNLKVDGTAQIGSGTLTIDSSRIIGSGDILITPTGVLNLGNTLITGDGTVSGNLKVDGTAIIGSGTVTIDSSRVVGSGDLYLSPTGNLQITSDATFSGDMSAAGLAVSGRSLLSDSTISNLYTSNAGGPGLRRNVALSIFEADQTVTTGDGQTMFPIPLDMNGWDLVDVIATVDSTGDTSSTDVMIRRKRSGSSANMLSTPVTIANEYYARDGVIDTDNDDVATGDNLFIDVDATTVTAPVGLSVCLTFEK